MGTGGQRRWAVECSRWLPTGLPLETLCTRCPQNVPAEVSPWTSHLMLLHRLVEAGCGFGPNDLTLDEWLGLGALKAALATDAAEVAKQGRRGQAENPTMLQITPGR